MTMANHNHENVKTVDVFGRAANVMQVIGNTGEGLVLNIIIAVVQCVLNQILACLSLVV